MTVFYKGLTEQVLKAVQPGQQTEISDDSRIHVHAAVSRFAVLYERIRNAVDYKDEHLLRKSALKRILNRQILLEDDPHVIANNLVKEMIGARYLPNDKLPESVLDEVAERIMKLQAVTKIRAGSERHYSWLRGIVTVEIEELLVDHFEEKSLVTFLYERLVGKILIQGEVLQDPEMRLQVYLACCRELHKSDDETLSYKLMRAYLPEWLRPEDWLANPRSMAERLVAVERRIRLSLANPLTPRIRRAIKPWAVSLNFLRDALKDRPEQARDLLNEPDSLNAVVARLADRRYKEARGKLRRGAVRATVYLFVTKMMIALLLEVPLEMLWYKHVSYLSLMINILLPPMLMFTVSLFIRIPGRDNTDRIKEYADRLLEKDGVPVRDIRARKKRGTKSKLLLSIIYAAMFIITFGSIGIILLKLDFTWLSAAIFYFFLCVVSFFAFRLRQNAREYIIVQGRDRTYGVVLDFLSYPILRAGQWLSRSISRINFFLFFLDFLVEAPFKMVLSVLEEWFAFMKEKKEELQ